MPDGPFESWPAADRLRWLADGMLGVGNDYAQEPAHPFVVIAWADAIHQIADEIDGSAPVVTPVALCGKTETTRRPDPCDRPQGHKGDCSWGSRRWRRIAVEYEDQLATMPQLVHDLKVAGVKIARLTRELDLFKLGPQAFHGRQASRRPVDPHG